VKIRRIAADDRGVEEMRPESATSWLCPNPGDRERLLDMEERLGPVRGAAFAVLVFAALFSAPWMGWWIVAPILACAAAFGAAGRGLATSPRPEHRIAFVWACSQLTIAACVALTGGAHSPGLAWFVVPAITLPVRFGPRGVAAGVTFTIVLLLAVTLGLDFQATIDGPERFLFPLAAIAAVALMSTALMRSDLEHRSEAVVDPLTGMLNRNALATRAVELAQQSAVTREPVALVVGDLDHFKSINDGHGHAVGDVVLKDVAYRIRKRLRAYDLAYRLGGEEFLVLLPGASSEHAAEVAEDLRLAIEGTTIANLAVTISFGVAASDPGEFDYEKVFAEADLALYEAKRSGRNQVRASGAAAVAA
jgi:diguanylate cyclase (GGDEF)-like protein